MIVEKKKPLTKVCSKCRIEKPRSEFYLRKKRNLSGSVYTCHSASCKACWKLATKSWESRNPERRRASARNYHRRKKFGVDSAEYLEMNANQNFSCAICGKADGKRRLDIDHDHRTMKVRELLCTNCNNGLGRFMDSPELLRRAAAYIEKHRPEGTKEEFDFGKWMLENFPMKKFTAVM